MLSKKYKLQESTKLINILIDYCWTSFTAKISHGYLITWDFKKGKIYKTKHLIFFL